MVNSVCYHLSDPCESSMLILYKDQSHKNHKQVLPLWEFAGCITFTKVEKVENVLMIFTEITTIVLAFDTPRLLDEWHHAIQAQFGKGKLINVIFWLLLQLNVVCMCLKILHHSFDSQWISSVQNNHSAIIYFVIISIVTMLDANEINTETFLIMY